MPVNDVHVATKTRDWKGVQEAEILLTFQTQSQRKEKIVEYLQTREWALHAWATGVWKDWAAERNRKVTTAHSTEETVNGDLLANTNEQLNKWLGKFVITYGGSKNRRTWNVLSSEQFISIMLWYPVCFENCTFMIRENFNVEQTVLTEYI